MQESWATCLLILRAILATSLRLTEAPAIRTAWTRKSTEELSVLTILACNISDLLWMDYNMKVGNFALAWTFSGPFLVSIVWLCVLTTIEKRFVSSMLKYALISLLGSAVLLYYIPLYIAGTVAVLANLVTILAPIMVISQALNEKDPYYIGLRHLTASTLSFIVLGVYSWSIKDFYMVVPNILGLYICLVQVIVLLWAKGWLPHSFLAQLSNMQELKEE